LATFDYNDINIEVREFEEIMAITNHNRVGKGLELLKGGLRPFVEREMTAALDSNWLARAAQTLSRFSDWRGQEEAPNLDVHALLLIMWDNWNEVFKLTLGHSERNLVSRLREVLSDWAHQKAFTTDDTYRAPDSMGRLLTAISAKEACDVEREKLELSCIKFEEQARWEWRKTAAAQLLAAVDPLGEAARDLAYRLYQICERKGWAQEALPYNVLVVPWSDIGKLSREVETVPIQRGFIF
jgi:hypothetical protein